MPKGSRGGKAGNASASSITGDSVVNGIKNAQPLDKDLVRRANDASFAVDSGNATQRQYESDVDRISKMENLNEQEKNVAYTQLHDLTESQLRAEAAAVNAMKSGRARYNVERGREQADKAAEARQRTRAYVSSLEAKNSRRAQNKNAGGLTQAMSDALQSGALSFTFNGKTYTRKSKRQRSFTAAR